MKKLSKKLLSILAALTLLVSLALPAGLLSATADTDPVVTKVNFELQKDGTTATTATDKEWDFIFGHVARGAGTEETPYVLKFDYYMPNASKVNVAGFGGDGNGALIGGTDRALKQGYHTFEGSFTANSQFYPRLTIYGPNLNAAADDVIYVWNISVTKGGTEYPLASTDFTNVYTDSSKTLSQYEWGDDLENLGGNPGGGNEDDDDDEPILPPPVITDDTVWLIDFPALKAQNGVNVYWINPAKALTVGAEYTLSFDYYAEGTRGFHVFDAARWGDNKDGYPDFSANNPRKVGKGHVTETFIAAGTGNFHLAFEPAGNDYSKLYIWNVSMVKTADAATNLLKGYDFSKSKNNVPIVSAKDLDPDTLGKPVFDEDPIVTKIDFDLQVDGTTPTYTEENRQWRHIFGFHRGEATVETPYVLSFEYYLPESCSAYVEIVGGGANGKATGATPKLKKGYHTYTCSYTTSSATGHLFAPAISILSTKQAADVNEMIYVWNYSVTKGGYACDFIEYPITNYINAYSDSSKKLSEYEWGDDLENLPGEEEGDGVNASTTPIEDNMYRIRYDLYDWEENNYQNYCIRWANIYVPGGVKEGDKLTLSFNWCVAGEGKVTAYNPYAAWAEHANNPGTYFTTEIGEKSYVMWGPEKGEFKLDFTANANDAKNGGGNMGIAFEQGIVHGQPKFYLWNLKLTYQGSDVNILTPDTFKWTNEEFMEIVDIDPDDIVYEETKKEEEDDKFDEDIDMDTGDIVLEETITEYDQNTSISIEYVEGTFGAGAYLNVYEYSADEIGDELIAVLGDKPYVAYDIGMVLGDDFDVPTNSVNLIIPVPDSLDAEQMHIYCVDIYGAATEVEFEVKYGSAYITTDVLGMFLLVEGEVEFPEPDESTDGDEPTDEPSDEPSDEPTDTEPETKPTKKPNKNNKKDNQSNDWLLWVLIGGGVVVLAAAAVIVLLVLKKRKAAK